MANLAGLAAQVTEQAIRRKKILPHLMFMFGFVCISPFV
jgi:hypothetical protein